MELDYGEEGEEEEFYGGGDACGSLLLCGLLFVVGCGGAV